MCCAGFYTIRANFIDINSLPICLKYGGVMNPGKEISDFSKEISENVPIFQAEIPDDFHLFFFLVI